MGIFFLCVLSQFLSFTNDDTIFPSSFSELYILFLGLEALLFPPH